MVNIIDLVGIWTAVFLTLMVLSFLYKENPFFRLTEYVFVGLSSGYAFAAALRLFINQALIPIFVDGSMDFVAPLVLGALFYAQFSKKYSTVYRVPLSLAIGYGLGITIWSVMQTYFVRQLTATMVPLYVVGDPITSLNNIVLVLGTILSLSYFILHREQKGTYGKITKIGKYFVLATLGAVFGSTVLGRMAIIIQRIQFLAGDPAFPWLALKMGTAQEGSYAPYAIILFLIVFGIYLYHERNTISPTRPAANNTKA
jgi:hypothetical protein